MNQEVSGILQIVQKGSGFLRDPARSFQAGTNDAWVSRQMIAAYRLEEGVEINGISQKGEKGIELVSIEKICGLAPAQFKERPSFERLLAINPEHRFRLGDAGDKTMRIIDLIAPIGKGTRGMIVSPPKAGKTTVLEKIAQAINETEPETRVIVLLIDERPEEVTHFRRHVQAEVLASSSDHSIEAHVNLVELTLAHVKSELECGRDIVLLVDSLTRLARAFNLHKPGSNRTLSGGLDARAMEIPRRFFGMARNIENGGSITVIATAQVNTGSRMDDFIFEEFKGTGNSEIVLDRTLAEARIFPAINILASGTRREELLYSEDEINRIALLRRALTGIEPKEAMRGMLNLINRTATNNELLVTLKAK
jgi:transcription termination factor Rho